MIVLSTATQDNPKTHVLPRPRAIPCIDEVTDQKAKPRGVGSRIQDPGLFTASPVMAARGSPQEEGDQGDTRGKMC